MIPRRLRGAALLALAVVLAGCPDPGPDPEARRVIDGRTPTPRTTPAATPGPTPERTPEPEPPSTPDPTPAPTPRPTREPDADFVRFAAVGDIGDGSATQRRVGDRIAALHREAPIDVLLLLGDMIYPDGRRDLYDPHFADPWRAVLDEGIRMEAALGNHDVQTENGQPTIDLFDMPGRWFHFESGPATFYSIETNHTRSEQTDWFRDTIARSRTPWDIPFLHAPLYSSGMHGGTGYVRRTFEPIFNEHGVAVVLAAHDHNYERTEPINGTVYMVAGTGCCLRDVGRSGFTAVAFSEPGVLIGEVTPTEMTLRFVHADGRVLDEATVPVDLPEREAQAAPAGASR